MDGGGCTVSGAGNGFLYYPPPIFVANTPVLGTRSLPHVHYEGRWWQRLGYRQPLGARGGSDCGASGHPALSLTLP